MRILFLALLLSGCAGGAAIAPSTSATRADINSANGRVVDARKANTDAANANKRARDISGRIEDKVMVLNNNW